MRGLCLQTIVVQIDLNVNSKVLGFPADLCHWTSPAERFVSLASPNNQEVGEEARTARSDYVRKSPCAEPSCLTIDIEQGARLEVTLPWLLARFAQAAQRVIGRGRN